MMVRVAVVCNDVRRPKVCVSSGSHGFHHYFMDILNGAMSVNSSLHNKQIVSRFEVRLTFLSIDN